MPGEKDVYFAHVAGNVNNGQVGSGRGKQEVHNQEVGKVIHGQSSPPLPPPPPPMEHYEYSSLYTAGAYPYRPRKSPGHEYEARPQPGWGGDYPPSDYPRLPEEPYYGYPPQPGWSGGYYGGGGGDPIYQGGHWGRHGYARHTGWIAAGAAAAGAGAYGAYDHFRRHHHHHHGHGGEYGGYGGSHGKFRHGHQGKFKHYAHHDGKFSDKKHAVQGKFAATKATATVQQET